MAGEKGGERRPRIGGHELEAKHEGNHDEPRRQQQPQSHPPTTLKATAHIPFHAFWASDQESSSVNSGLINSELWPAGKDTPAVSLKPYYS